MINFRLFFSLLAILAAAHNAAFCQDSISRVQSAIAEAKLLENCFSMEAMVEFPDQKTDTVRLRRNEYAYLDLQADAIQSVSVLTRQELEEVPREQGVSLNDPSQKGTWCRVLVKKGSQGSLSVKSAQVDFVFDTENQEPFYIDLEAEQAVYLEKGEKAEALIDCSNPNDRCNQRVYVWDCKCCCRSRRPECYGFVGCDDGWSRDRCCPD